MVAWLAKRGWVLVLALLAAPIQQLGLRVHEHVEVGYFHLVTPLLMLASLPVLLRGKRKLRLGLPELFLVMYVIAVFLSAPFAVLTVGGVVRLATTAFAALYYFWLRGYFSRVGLHETGIAVRIAVAFASSTVVIGVVQFGWTYLSGMGPIRVTATFKDPNYYAAYLAPLFALSLYGAVAAKSRCGGFLQPGTIAGGILLTMSRGGLAALSASVLYVVAAAPRAARARVMVALVVITSFVLTMMLVAPSVVDSLERRLTSQRGESWSSVRARVVILETAIRMVESHPVTGIGPGRFEEEFRTYAPFDYPRDRHATHNSFLRIAAESGIPAAIMMIAFVSSLMLQAFRVSRRREGAFAPFVGGAVTATCVAYSFLDGIVSPSAMTVLALASAVVEMEKQR